MPALLLPRRDARSPEASTRCAEAAGPDAYRLVRPGESSYSRDLFALVRGAGQDHSARVDVERGTGSVRPVEPAGTGAKRFGPEGGVKLDPPRRSTRSSGRCPACSGRWACPPNRRPSGSRPNFRS